MEQKSPNILLLFSDQHRADVMGCEGHPDVMTPHLDKLAGAGVRFSRAYCQDAVCMASRIALHTGLHPRTVGVLNNTDCPSVLREVTPLSTALSERGYVTAAFGKRHLDSLEKLSPHMKWDVAKSHFQVESPADNYVTWIEAQGCGEAFLKDWAAEHGGVPPGGRYAATTYPIAPLATRVSDLPADKTMEAYTANETIRFLKETNGASQPFFCWSNFYRPHQPYNPLPEFMRLYDVSRWGQGTKAGSAIQRPASLDEPKEHLPPILQEWRSGTNAVWCLNLAKENEQLYRDYIGGYYALVTEIDHHVGRIIKTLEEENLLDNTIIIYTSDHGDFVGHHGMVEKCAGGHNVYEDTLRVPLIAYWKDKFQSGLVSTDLVELIDLFPTLLDSAGIPRPIQKYPLAGQSLLPILRDGRRINRPYIVSENWSQAAIVTERYKLGIMLDAHGRGEKDYRSFGDMLFDRDLDPLELTNLAGQQEYQPIQSQLRKHYADWTATVSSAGKDELLKTIKG